MPPKKRKLTGWTRRGCVTCKRRQKKCDEARPRCKNCTRLNLHCEAFDVFQVVGPADLARHSSSLQNSNAHGIEPKTTESEPPRANEQTSIETPTGDEVEELSVPSTSSSTSQHTNVRPSATSPPGSGGLELGADFNWDDHFSDLPAWGGSPLFSVRSDSPEEIREVTSYSRASPQLDQQYISRFPTVSQTEVFLLNHYFDKLCPILVNVDSPANPLKSVLIPRALTSAMLLHSVCAISACHFANTKNESGPETRQVAIAFYTKAVRALNTALADDTSASNADRSIFDILLLTAVFICKYQITKGSISKWRPLLKGVQQMLETFDASLMPETRSYVESFVVYHTTVASVLDMVYFPTAPKSLLWNEETARSRSVDPYMGLSSDYISLLERTSALYRWSASVEDERSSLFAELRHIVFDIETLSSTVPGREGHGLSEATQAGIQSVAKAYQYAIWVWMHSVIEHMASARRHQLSMYDKGLAKAGLAMSKEQAISKCLAAILDIPYGQPCEAALVFLLFVLGCETDNVAEWEVIFTRLKALEGNLQIGNVRRVREFLEVVRDSKSSPDGEHDWQVLLEQRHWDLILS